MVLRRPSRYTQSCNGKIEQKTQFEIAFILQQSHRLSSNKLSQNSHMHTFGHPFNRITIFLPYFLHQFKK